MEPLDTPDEQKTAAAVANIVLVLFAVAAFAAAGKILFGIEGAATTEIVAAAVLAAIYIFLYRRSTNPPEIKQH